MAISKSSIHLMFSGTRLPENTLYDISQMIGTSMMRNGNPKKIDVYVFCVFSSSFHHGPLNDVSTFCGDVIRYCHFDFCAYVFGDDIRNEILI